MRKSASVKNFVLLSTSSAYIKTTYTVYVCSIMITISFIYKLLFTKAGCNYSPSKRDGQLTKKQSKEQLLKKHSRWDKYLLF